MKLAKSSKSYTPTTLTGAIPDSDNNEETIIIRPAQAEDYDRIDEITYHGYTKSLPERNNNFLRASSYVCTIKGSALMRSTEAITLVAVLQNRRNKTNRRSSAASSRAVSSKSVVLEQGFDETVLGLHQGGLAASKYQYNSLGMSHRLVGESQGNILRTRINPTLRARLQKSRVGIEPIEASTIQAYGAECVDSIPHLPAPRRVSINEPAHMYTKSKLSDFRDQMSVSPASTISTAASPLTAEELMGMTPECPKEVDIQSSFNDDFENDFDSLKLTGDHNSRKRGKTPGTPEESKSAVRFVELEQSHLSVPRGRSKKHHRWRWRRDPTAKVEKEARPSVSTSPPDCTSDYEDLSISSSQMSSSKSEIGKSTGRRLTNKLGEWGKRFTSDKRGALRDVERGADESSYDADNENTVSAITEEIVGSVTYAPYESGWAIISEPGDVEIRMLAVAAKAGVAEALVNYCIKLAKAEGRCCINSLVPKDHIRAQTFYKRNGFVSNRPKDRYDEKTGQFLKAYMIDLGNPRPDMPVDDIDEEPDFTAGSKQNESYKTIDSNRPKNLWRMEHNKIQATRRVRKSVRPIQRLTSRTHKLVCIGAEE